MRLRWFVLACWLLAGSAQGKLYEPFISRYGTDLDVCPEVIKERPGKFSAGCYVGSGIDDRVIPIGFNNAAGWVLEKSTGTDNQCASYHTTAMGAAVDSSCSLNNCVAGGGTCAANRFQEITSKAIEIGDDHDVNRSGAAYCWYLWQEKPYYFVTHQYTGNGGGNRDIDLGMTPDVVLVINETSSVTAVLKLPDMPANTSCKWDQGFAEGACHTDGVRNYLSIGDGDSVDGIEVGAARNANSIVYNVFAWKEHYGYLQTGTYTGDGDSLGGGNASATDTQVISVPGCDVKYVMITGRTASGLDYECDGQRGVNISTTVSGPGYIALEPYKQMQQTLDEAYGIRDLTNGSFTVTGAPSLSHSCNDLNVPYYYWVMCEPIAQPGQINPQDWCPNSMDACWHLEETQGQNRLNAALFGCTTDCDLLEDTAVQQDTTNKQEGGASAEFDGSSSLKCETATCGAELNDPAGDVTWYCRGRPDNTTGIQVMLAQSNNQYIMFCDGTTFTCIVRNEADDTSQSATITNACATDTWAHYACNYDLSDDELTPYYNGVAGTPAAVAFVRGSSNNNAFRLGRDAKAAQNWWSGDLDDCGVDFSDMSASSICRLCACNSTGPPCTCFADDPTLYVDDGYWGSLCQSCALPACNAVTP